MARHLECAGLGVQHADAGGLDGLHPHLGGRLTDVAQDGPEHERHSSHPTGTSDRRPKVRLAGAAAG